MNNIKKSGSLDLQLKLSSDMVHFAHRMDIEKYANAVK